MASKKKKGKGSNVIPLHPAPRKKAKRKKRAKKKKVYGPRQPLIRFKELSELDLRRLQKEWEQLASDPNLEITTQVWETDAKGKLRRVYSPEEQAERDARTAARKKAKNERARFQRRKKKVQTSPRETTEPPATMTAAKIFDLAKHRPKKP